jgi:hypothetical protein
MIRIEINTDNAAFEGDDERLVVARILRDLADKIEQYHNPEVLMDLNGNRCGTLELL